MDRSSEFEDAEEELKASNEVLKLKLEVEYGMRTYESNGMTPELENQWLQYIYQHEALYKSCGRIKMYDYIGRPQYTPIEELRPGNITSELERLLAIMATYGVRLDCLEEYDDSIIYRFLTTELFSEEMDNIRLPGLVHHFTYEEYHMNNEHEIKRIGFDLIKSIYNHEWHPEYDSIWLGASVKCNGIDQDFMGFSALITGFQSRHAYLEMKNLTIHEVAVDQDATSGVMRATLSYLSQFHGSDDRIEIEGPCELRYTFNESSKDWSITEITMPGVLGIRK